jgi:predicted nucleotidyltransferase
MYLSKEERTIIVDFLRQAFSPKFIYLFGSFAKGEGREDSDIDLAIYTDRPIHRKGPDTQHILDFLH